MNQLILQRHINLIGSQRLWWGNPNEVILISICMTVGSIQSTFMPSTLSLKSKLPQFFPLMGLVGGKTVLRCGCCLSGPLCGSSLLPSISLKREKKFEAHL